MSNNSVGVVVGRFQVHELHEAHLQLLNYVKNHNDHMIVFLGVKPAPADSLNPLDFQIRRAMISQVLSDITILPLMDQPTDEGWSKTLDSMLWNLYGDRPIKLYSGPDGFVPRYKGRYPTKELEFGVDKRGTDIRNAIASMEGASEEFRAGVIHALSNLPHRTYFTVDMICHRVRDGKLEIVVVRKNSDGGLWRLPGGFLGNNDSSLELAAKRELHEEIGIVSEGKAEYLFSTPVDDWRSRGATDVRHMTAVFAIPYFSGPLEAQDDIDDAHWVSINMEDSVILKANMYTLLQQIVPEHKMLVEQGIYNIVKSLTNKE